MKNSSFSFEGTKSGHLSKFFNKKSQNVVTEVAGADQIFANEKSGNWTCVKCSAENKNSATFCVKCGQAKTAPAPIPSPVSVNATVIPASSDSWTCTFCGEKNNGGKFCCVCGKPNNDNLKKPVVSDSFENWKCTFCGEENKGGKFCCICGKENQNTPLPSVEDLDNSGEIKKVENIKIQDIPLPDICPIDEATSEPAQVLAGQEGETSVTEPAQVFAEQEGETSVAQPAQVLAEQEGETSVAEPAQVLAEQEGETSVAEPAQVLAEQEGETSVAEPAQVLAGQKCENLVAELTQVLAEENVIEESAPTAQTQKAVSDKNCELRWICPTCDRENREISKFCLTCGMPRAEDALVKEVSL